MSREKDEKVFKQLHPTTQREIVEHIQYVLSEETLNQLRKAIEDDPEEWWVPYHFGWGMWIRNSLREGVGLDDQKLDVDKTYDDYYVYAVEKAVREYDN